MCGQIVLGPRAPNICAVFCCKDLSILLNSVIMSNLFEIKFEKKKCFFSQRLTFKLSLLLFYSKLTAGFGFTYQSCINGCHRISTTLMHNAFSHFTIQYISPVQVKLTPALATPLSLSRVKLSELQGYVLHKEIKCMRRCEPCTSEGFPDTHQNQLLISHCSLAGLL